MNKHKPNLYEFKRIYNGDFALSKSCLRSGYFTADELKQKLFK